MYCFFWPLIGLGAQLPDFWWFHRDNSPIMSRVPSSHSSESPHASKSEKNDGASDANIRNFAPVARIMKTALPENAKIAKEAKECMQECVSEFISFITSEGSCNIFF